MKTRYEKREVGLNMLNTTAVVLFLLSLILRTEDCCVYEYVYVYVYTYSRFYSSSSNSSSKIIVVVVSY